MRMLCFAVSAFFIGLSACMSAVSKEAEVPSLLEACHASRAYKELSSPSPENLQDYNRIIATWNARIPITVEEIYRKKCAMSYKKRNGQPCFFLLEKIPTPGGGIRACRNDHGSYDFYEG